MSLSDYLYKLKMSVYWHLIISEKIKNKNNPTIFNFFQSLSFIV